MVTQYKIDKYLIDLYFLDYKLAIECDENHTDIEYDNKRQQYVEYALGCKFIRYKPYDKNFNIFSLLNDIYVHISNYKILNPSEAN